MTLRKKTLLIIGNVLIGLFLIVLMTSYDILLQGFKDLEQQNVYRNLKRLTNILNDELHRLYVQAGDYAKWDDTYNYMHTQNENYLQSNLSIGTFTDLNLNLIILLNEQGELIFGKNYHRQSSSLEALSPTYHNLFSYNSSFLHPQESKEGKSGLLVHPNLEPVLMLAHRPILTSHGEGPNHGTLIMGRYLDPQEIEKFGKLIGFPLTMQRIDHTQLPADFVELYPILLKNKQAIQLANDHQIAGYLLVTDFHDQPAILFRLDMPRDIYYQGLNSLRYLSIVVLIIVLIFAGLILWVIEHLILARLATLSQQMMRIRTSGEFLMVTVKGNDELSHLALTLNQMLTALQASYAHLHHSQIRLAEAQRIAHLGNWEWEMANQRLTCSEEIYRIFGISPPFSLISYQPFLKQVPVTDHPLIIKAFQQACQDRKPYTLELRILRNQQEERFIQLQGEVITNEEGKITHLVGTVQDITERKQSQAETVRLLEENRFLIHRSIAIQEEERRYLARELHDEFGQCITAIQADAEAIVELTHNSLPECFSKIRTSANAINEVSSHMYEVVHTLMRQLRPSGLDELGLVEILQNTVRHWQNRYPQTNCHLQVIGNLDNLGETLNISIYRIIQECLTNTAKHAQASEVKITLQLLDLPEISYFSELRNGTITNYLKLVIQDNGQGMDLAQHHRGLGLIGIRERVKALKGEVDLQSTIGQGTFLSIVIPMGSQLKKVN